MSKPIVIYGDPKGKGRPRMMKNGVVFTPSDTKRYEEQVAKRWIELNGDLKYNTEPLSLNVISYMAIPKSASKIKREAMLSGDLRPTKTPDIDNILKIIMDGLNKIAFHDDRQVVEEHSEKFYSDVPRVEVELRVIK